MKKYIKMASCVLGGVMIGFFANQLNTIVGTILFTLGIILIVMSGISLGNNTRKF